MSELHDLPELSRLETTRLPLTASAVDAIVAALLALPGVSAAGPLDATHRKKGTLRGVWIAVRAQGETALALATGALNVAAETTGIGVEFNPALLTAPEPWWSDADQVIGLLDDLARSHLADDPEAAEALGVLYGRALAAEAASDPLSYTWRTTGVPPTEPAEPPSLKGADPVPEG